MALPQLNSLGAPALIEGTPMNNGVYVPANPPPNGDAEEEEDDDDDEEQDEEEEESDEVDPEEAAHAVSVCTQWVYARDNAREGIRVLCRVAVQDFSNELVYDRFVRPPQNMEVTDYRQPITGVSAAELYGPAAVDFATARAQVGQRVQGRLLIGHGLWEVLYLLNARHPMVATRDLALYLPFQPALNAQAPPNLNAVPPAIVAVPALTHAHLPLREHWMPLATPRVNAPDYAEAQMFLYHRARQQWEAFITTGIAITAPPPTWFANYYL